MTPAWAILVFTIQGVALGVDEFVFHRARGLPRWEKLGHPLDTLSVLLCLGMTLFMPAQWPWNGVYIGMAIFSCLWVTKDEWVHHGLCHPFEQWLHALLFMLHPILLGVIYWLWQNGTAQSKLVLRIETAFAALFMLYQALYWNMPWPKKSLK